MKERLMWFLAPEGAGGGGGEGGNGAAGLAAFDDGAEPGVSPAGDATGGDAPAGGGGDEPKPTGGFDAKALGQEFAEHLKTVFRPQEQHKQDEPPLSPEEAKKLLKVWEPDDAFVAEFGNLETQKQAFAKLRDFIITQADTIAQVRMQKLREELAGEYKPALEYITEARQEKLDREFAETYPDLGKPELKPILTAIADSFRKEGKTFNKPRELFDALAKAAESVIQQANPEFKLNGAQAPAKQQQTRQTNAIPVTTPGSGGGGGGGGDKGTPTKRGLAIFGK